MTGTVVLDLTAGSNRRATPRHRDDEEPERSGPHHKTADLRQIPDGARVILLVADVPLEPWTAAELHYHQERLHFDVHGDADAVQAWVLAIRTGELVW